MTTQQLWQLSLGTLDPVAAEIADPARATGHTHLPVYAYAIATSAGDIALVDLGPPAPRQAARLGYMNVCASDFRTPAEATAEADISPSAVRWIVLTHLHWDHIHGGAHFPGAEVIVQEAELAAALDPRSNQARYYRAFLDGGGVTSQLTVVSGDVELTSGLHIVATPGHTPGSQTVLLDQGHRIVAFCGDLAHRVESLTGTSLDGPTPSHVPAIMASREEWRRSLLALAEQDVTPLLAHDERSLVALTEDWGLSVDAGTTCVRPRRTLREPTVASRHDTAGWLAGFAADLDRASCRRVPCG